MSKPNINENVLLAEQAYAAAMSSVTEDNTIVIQDAEGKDISNDIYKQAWSAVAPDIEYEVGERAHMAREQIRAGAALAFGRKANQHHKANEQSKMVTGSFATGKNASVDVASERKVVHEMKTKDKDGNDQVSRSESFGTLTIRSRQTYSQSRNQPYNGVRTTVSEEAKELFGNVAAALND